MIKDSGERRTFETGAQRDRAFGKGRPTLISPYWIKFLYTYGCNLNEKRHCSLNLQPIITDCYLLMIENSVSIDNIVLCITQGIMTHFKSNIEAIRQLSKHMEEGAKKYEDRNWEKGMPLCEYLDSCIRHCMAIAEGKRDENHKAAALFNIMAFYHTYVCIQNGSLPKELDNLPRYR